MEPGVQNCASKKGLLSSLYIFRTSGTCNALYQQTTTLRPIGSNNIDNLKEIDSNIS